jgi:hypothetical protein
VSAQPATTTLKWKYLSISDRSFKQLLEVLVSFSILVALLSPLCNDFSVEDENVEEHIKQQDDILLNRDTIKQNRLRRDVEGIRHERWLDHDQGVVDIFLVEDPRLGVTRRIQT